MAPRPTAIVDRILKKPAAERLKLLRESTNPQAQFLWAILRDSFHYAAVHLADIADSAREIDFAMRWGFGSKQGPFELWQEAGWKQVAHVGQGRHRRRQVRCRPRRCPPGCSTARGRTACTRRRLVERRRMAFCTPPVSTLPVYKRQLFPESRAGRRRAPSALKSGTELNSGTSEVRVWTLDGEVLIATHHRQDAPDQPRRLRRPAEGGRDLAEKRTTKGLVIWSPDEMFSAGANLEAMLPVFMKMGAKGIAPEEKKLQDR